MAEVMDDYVVSQRRPGWMFAYISDSRGRAIIYGRVGQKADLERAVVTLKTLYALNGQMYESYTRDSQLWDAGYFHLTDEGVPVKGLPESWEMSP